MRNLQQRKWLHIANHYYWFQSKDADTSEGRSLWKKTVPTHSRCLISSLDSTEIHISLTTTLSHRALTTTLSSCDPPGSKKTPSVLWKKTSFLPSIDGEPSCKSSNLQPTWPDTHKWWALVRCWKICIFIRPSSTKSIMEAIMLISYKRQPHFAPWIKLSKVLLKCSQSLLQQILVCRKTHCLNVWQS